jgi:hypothetical protein
MTDYHTHIGQYYDSYYDFHDVFKVLKDNGIDENICAYFTPKFDKKDASIAFYHAVEEELFETGKFAETIGLKTRFLYWADPLVLEQLPLETIFSKFPYFGIALHPFLHNWTTQYSNLVSEIFSFSDKHKLPIFIHTGTSACDEPMQFEKWFVDFPNVEVHLAHCKEPKVIIKLFSKHQNLFGDTAFCPAESYNKICEAGLKNRMLFGSDFPITHWHEQQQNPNYDLNSLSENYKKVLLEAKLFLKEMHI